MRFLHDKFGMGAVLIGVTVSALLLFLQNSGMASLSDPVLAAIWWLFAWPFMLAALLVAFTAWGNNASPGWGIPLLLIAMIANVAYFYLMGKLVGFVVRRVRG